MTTRLRILLALTICLTAVTIQEQGAGFANTACNSSLSTVQELKENNGLHAGPDLEANPIILWRYALGTTIEYLDFQDGLVYVSGQGTGLVGLDSSSGEVAHRFEFDSRASDGGLFTVSDPYIVGTSYSSDEASIFLYAIDNGGGNVSSIWGMRYQGWITAAPFYGDDSLFLTHISTGFSFVLGISSLDAANGEKIWSYRVPEEQLQRVGLAGRSQDYLTASERHVFLKSPGIAVAAVSRVSGEECWVNDDIAPSVGSIALADGHLYVPTEGDSLMALLTDDGEEKWSEANISGLSSPAAGNGQVYIGGQDGSLISLGARTGEKNWAFESSDFTRAQISITDRLVYALSGDGHLYAISAGDGSLIWKLNMKSNENSHISDYVGPRPLVVNEMIFVAAGDVLFALVSSINT